MSTTGRHLPVITGRTVALSRPEPVPFLRMWGWTALSGSAILLLIFGGYEIVERSLLVDAAPELLYGLHIARGMGSAVALGTWGLLAAARFRRHYADELTRNVQMLEEQVADRSAALDRHRAFTEHLFDHLHDRIVVTDAVGTVVKVNRVARESIPETCTVQCGVAMQCGERCKVPTDEPGIVRDPDSGRIYQVDRYPVPVRPGDAELVLEVARDVTDAKQLEALVVHQEKMACLGVLAAGIAHDIGNPLASLSSELEMLELEDDPAKVHEAVRVLRQHVERIGRALREMVDFARRRGEEEHSELSVGTAISDAMRLVRHDKRMRDVSFSVDLEEGLPPIQMIEDHLVLVIVNLLINALDAMPEGGTLGVGAKREAERVVITVTDSGEGMSEEVAERALELMFTTKTHDGGTGLGLSVSDSVLRAAGGELRIRSEEGKGTEIDIVLTAGGEPGG